MKKIILNILFLVLVSPLKISYALQLLAENVSSAQGNTVREIKLSICSESATRFGLKNNAPASLKNIKNFLLTASVVATLSPRNVAEDMMRSNNAADIIFYCKDLSTINDFSAEIAYSYADNDNTNRTPTLTVHMVPPREKNRPKPLVTQKSSAENFTEKTNQMPENELNPSSYADQLK